MALPQLTHLDCYTLPPVKLPATLTYLRTGVLPDNYHLPLLTRLHVSFHILPTFPPNITFLDVENLSGDPSDFFLSSKITHLILGRNGSNALPPLLQHLTLRAGFRSPLPSLPKQLISLTLNNNFDQRLPLLPSSLKKLLFPSNLKYSHHLPKLPSSLKYLFLPEIYDLSLPNIPKSLLRLQCMLNLFA